MSSMCKPAISTSINNTKSDHATAVFCQFRTSYSGKKIAAMSPPKQLPSLLSSPQHFAGIFASEPMRRALHFPAVNGAPLERASRYHISTTNLVKSLHLFHHLFTFYGICRVLCSNVYLLLLILLNGLYNKPNSEFKQTLKSFWLKVPNTTQDLTGNYNNPVMSVCYRVLFPVNHTSR